MPHGDTIVDGNGVELLGDTARAFDLPSDQLSEVLQVHMAQYELRKAIGDRDDRLPKSESFMPVARHNPRAPATLRP